MKYMVFINHTDLIKNMNSQSNNSNETSKSQMKSFVEKQNEKTIFDSESKSIISNADTNNFAEFVDKNNNEADKNEINENEKDKNEEDEADENEEDGDEESEEDEDEVDKNDADKNKTDENETKTSDVSESFIEFKGFKLFACFELHEDSMESILDEESIKYMGLFFQANARVVAQDVMTRIRNKQDKNDRFKPLLLAVLDCATKKKTLYKYHTAKMEEPCTLSIKTKTGFTPITFAFEEKCIKIDDQEIIKKYSGIIDSYELPLDDDS